MLVKLDDYPYLTRAAIKLSVRAGVMCAGSTENTYRHSLAQYVGTNYAPHLIKAADAWLSTLTDEELDIFLLGRAHDRAQLISGPAAEVTNKIFQGIFEYVG